MQPNDPFREKLLRAREALLTREKELIMEQRMGEIKVENGEVYGQMGESSAEGRRRSSAGLNHGLGLKSGKARAMEEIQASEVNLHPNGIILYVGWIFLSLSFRHGQTSLVAVPILQTTATSFPISYTIPS